MKRNMWFVLVAVGYLSCTVLLGCATVKEMGKGFLGISTQVLEEKRKDALKKSFALDYNRCDQKVRDILSQKGKEVPIYAQDAQNKMIAVYLSATDTTPVGIFFSQESDGNTLIEISSPSSYAKEEIANRIFTGIGSLIKPKPQEKKIDVKEIGN